MAEQHPGDDAVEPTFSRIDLRHAGQRAVQEHRGDDEFAAVAHPHEPRHVQPGEDQQRHRTDGDTQRPAQPALCTGLPPQHHHTDNINR